MSITQKMLIPLTKLSNNEILTEYPYIISRGHLNNYFREHKDRSLANFQETEKDTCLMLCLRAVALTKSAYDVYWARFSKRVTSSYCFSIEEKIDLISSVCVKGGTFAKINSIDMKWIEDEQVWKPLCCDAYFVLAAEPLCIHTDGDYVYCNLGIISSTDLRRKYLDLSFKTSYL